MYFFFAVGVKHTFLEKYAYEQIEKILIQLQYFFTI